MAGPFSRVSLFVTDKKNGKWVNTLIVGSASLIMLKDVGAPISVIRIMQESEIGEIGQLIFETEIPLNFKLEKLAGNFTAISFLNTEEFVGFYFNKGVSDCSIFNMHLTELNENLTADAMKKSAFENLVKVRE